MVEACSCNDDFIQNVLCRCFFICGPGVSSLWWKGCSLRNTEFIVGVVIFTGHESKVMMNSMKIPSKRSTLEKKLDKLILALFTTLFCMCLF